MNLIAKGNTAEIYDYGNGKVCKLFWNGYPVDGIQREFSNAQLMHGTALLTPKVFGMVEIDGRHGIIYQKLSGKSLLKEFFENPECVMEILGEMAELQKQLHIHSSDKLMSYKDYLRFFDYEDTDKLPEGNDWKLESDCPITKGQPL